MDRRAQAQIITVVLIILLVLAAIVIVWQVIRSTVQESAAEVAGGTECITLDLALTKYTAGEAAITVKRSSGAGNLAKIKVIIDGESKGEATVTLEELETEIIDLSALTIPHILAATEVVEIAGIISTEGGGTKLCDVADKETVA